MEPGLAFGSGYHPTTQGCLTLLRRVYEADPPRQVLDLGTGTGILTLACPGPGGRAGGGGGVQRTGGAHRRPEPEAQSAPGRGGPLIQADARDFAHLPAELALANIHLDVLLDLLDIPEFLQQKLVHLLRHPGAPRWRSLPPASTPHP